MLPENHDDTKTDTPDLYQSLVHYTKAGWDTPFPLPPGSKTPPPTGYTGRAALTPSPADLWSWSEEYPVNSNIGLHLPPDMIGIDVDNYGGKHGYDTYNEAQERYGPLPLTVMSTSRDDGKSGIRLYRVPEGTEYPGVLGAGVDIIQNHHRYMVVAPSTHPEGGTYEWVDERTGLTTGFPTGLITGLIPDLPEAWVAGLQLEAKTTLTAQEGTTAAQVLADLPAGPPCHHQHDTSGQWDTRIAGSSGHDTMSTLTYETLLLGREGCPGSIAALDKIKALFLLETSSRRDPLEAEREFHRSVEGAALKAASKPQVSTGCRDDTAFLVPTNGTSQGYPGLPASNVGVDLWASGEPEPPRRSSWAPKDLTDIINGHETERPPTHLQRDDGASLIYSGKVNSLLGDSESGKTWVALHAIQQAIGAGERALLIDLEDSPTGIVNRLRLLGVSDQQLLEQFDYTGPDEPVDSPETRADYQGILNSGYDLIVLDGVSGCMRLFGFSINSNDDVADFDLRILKPLAKTGAAVIMIDHLPKGDGTGKDRAPGAIGAQHKRAAISGSSIAVKASTKPRPGGVGRLTLTVDKDRPGLVREASSAKGVVGTMEIDSSDPSVTSITLILEETPSTAEEESSELAEVLGLLKAAGVSTTATSDAAAKEAGVRRQRVGQQVMAEYRRTATSSECQDCGEPVTSGKPRCQPCYQKGIGKSGVTLPEG